MRNKPYHMAHMIENRNQKELNREMDGPYSSWPLFWPKAAQFWDVHFSETVENEILIKISQIKKK